MKRSLLVAVSILVVLFLACLFFCEIGIEVPFHTIPLVTAILLLSAFLLRNHH